MCLLPSFSFLSLRAGTVYSIKMLLEHQCAFVNYTRKEDCERAIKCINVCTILIVMTVTDDCSSFTVL